MGFPAIAAQLGITIGLWAINRLLLDQEKKLPEPTFKPIQFALNTIGTPIPYIAGTVRVAPVLIWYGNQGVSFVSSGERYRADMAYAIGVPMWDSADEPWSSWRTASPPKLRKLWYGDRRIFGLTELAHAKKGQILLNPGGGDDPVIEAGVHFYDGRPDQNLDGTPLALKMVIAGIDATDVPSYQHRMLLGLFATPGSLVAIDPNLGGLGSNPQVSSVAVEVSALGPQPIGLDANPAWIIYDLLVRPVWGLGINPADVDFDSFQAAADTLLAEGHGCSVAIESPENAAKVLSAIEAQVDGVLYEAPSTGKLKFKLIRANYNPDDLQVMNADNVVGRPTIDDIHERDCPNEMRVNFTDRARDYKADTLPWQKQASAAARGNQRRPTSFDAPGCMNAELAAKIAARELAVVGRPMRTIKIKVNREFYALELGDVVKVHLPQYQISNEIYRVLEADFGQLADGAITVRLIRDVFDQTVGGYVGDPGPAATPITVLPLTERLASEAPWFAMYLCYQAGVIPDLTSQRLLAAAVAEGDLGDRFRGRAQSGGLTGILGAAAVEHGVSFFPTTARVAALYPRHLEPYDTTTGLLVDSVAGEHAAVFATLVATDSDIEHGTHLALVGDELIAFKSVTSLSGGQYRLNSVLRGLLDTAPVEHAVGERFYLIDTRAVGRRAWPIGFAARVFAIPSYKNTLGSDGVDASDDIAEIRGRASLSLPAADVRVSGYDLEGTRGLPAVVQTAPYLGGFKVVSRLDGAFDIAGRERKREVGIVVRGDDPTNYTAEAGTTWDVYAQKLGDEGGDEVAIRGHTGLSSPSSSGILLGQAGHGTLRVKLRTQNAGRASWQDAPIDVTAAPYRNLLAFGSCENSLIGPSWSNVVGTAQFGGGTLSLPRTATGRWFVFATALAGITTIRQEVDVTGYAAGGLSALVTFYARNAAGDTDDYATAAITALDDAGAPIGATTTSSNIVGPLTHWRRAEVSKTLPNGTVKVRVDITMRGGTGDDTVPNVGVTGIGLQLGQMSAQLLSNPSFDDELDDWTPVDDAFVVNDTNPYASNNGTLHAAQGGDADTTEIFQDQTIPAGYEYGVALLSFARSTVAAGDTGEVVIEALNGSDTVLASSTTGATTSATLNIWDRGRVALQLPDGATKLRVRLIATRGGVGASGACFDDLHLRIHKDLDARHRYDFDFRAPAWVPAPTTWQRFHLAYPTQPVPAMVWGGLLAEPSIQPSERLDGPTHAWSDGTSPGAAKFTGYWDVGPHPLFDEPTLRYAPVTDAYQFTRAAAGAAVDLQTSGADVDGEEYGAFSLDEPFTIAVQFRVDEPVFGGACGLVGRRGVSGIGWGLLLNGSGQPVAVLQGTAGTASATASNATTDRAPHWAILSNDGAGTLTLYDDFGGTTTTSTAGLGSIDVAGVPLRIGRDGPASATGGIQIARVLVWRVALSGAEAAAIMRYGDDPSPSTPIGTWYSNQAVWVPGPDDGVDGVTLVRFADHHVPIGYGGGGYGLALASANTNKIPSYDLADTDFWIPETGVTLTQGVVDPTGLPRGVSVANAGANQNLRCEGITMGVGTPLSVVLWARTLDGVARTLEVELLDSTSASIAAATVALTEDWQRFVVQLGPWSAPTATAILRFGLASSAVGSFDLGHVMWAGFGTDVPWAIQDAGLANINTFGSKIVSLPRQANREGELYIECLGSVASPSSGKVLVSIDNDVNTNGMRALMTAAGGVPRFELRNAIGTATNSDGTAVDWAAEDVVLRGRWNRLELPESLDEQQGIVVEGSVDSAAYTANAFTVLLAGLTAIRIGGGGFSGGSPHALIRRVIVRAREPKLAGS